MPLGRTLETLQYEGAGAIAVTSTYDALGQVLFRSNPLRPADAVNGTNYQYDLLGRIVQQTATQDAQGVTTTYAGNLATVRDEAGKVRSTMTDAGGRVAQVVEDPAGSALQGVCSTTRRADRRGIRRRGRAIPMTGTGGG